MGGLGGQNRAVAAAALVFSKIDVLEEKWCQDACWEDLGSIWVAKRIVLGGQKGPSRHQKRDQNDIDFLMDFWIDFGPEAAVT